MTAEKKENMENHRKLSHSAERKKPFATQIRQRNNAAKKAYRFGHIDTCLN